METAAGSSTLGEVSAREVARRSGIPYTTVLVRYILLSYPYKIEHRHELLPSNFAKRRAFTVCGFQKMTEGDDWLSNMLWIDEALSHFESLSTPTTAEFGLLKILDFSYFARRESHIVVRIYRIYRYRALLFLEEMRDSGLKTVSEAGENYADMS